MGHASGGLPCPVQPKFAPGVKSHSRPGGTAERGGDGCRLGGRPQPRWARGRGRGRRVELCGRPWLAVCTLVLECRLGPCQGLLGTQCRSPCLLAWAEGPPGWGTAGAHEGQVRGAPRGSPCPDMFTWSSEWALVLSLRPAASMGRPSCSM